MRMRALVLAALAAGPVFAQNSSSSDCLNYGVSNAGGCDCPAGFGGPQSNKCDLPVCGGSLYLPEGVGAGKFGDVSDCKCTDGWDGPTCTVCKSSDACVQTLTHYINSTNQLGVPGLNSSLVCNAQPVVYAASHMTCEVVQPMLQTLFPGHSQLTISRFLNGTSSPGGAGGLQSAHIANGAGEVWAQLWYNGTEQFYCHGSECTQEITSGSEGGNGSDWTCPVLQCHCRPGTSFCGGGTSATQDLSAVINTLQGPLNIKCTAAECKFDQKFLRLFGQTGLPLSDCSFGECVNQYIIDKALGLDGGSAKGSSRLSGGVIAGLAVVGAILLAIILLALWGLIRQKKARKIMNEGAIVKKGGGVGLAWHNVGYEVVGRRRGLYNTTISWLRGFGNPDRPETPRSEDGTMTSAGGGRRILHDVCGELPAGAFCCILGPSGAGKSTLVDILAGRRKAGIVEGKVSYLTNTADRNVKIGYCDQSDVLSPTSTVLETLIFAAKLRLPENVPMSVKEERARTVLNQLGLNHIANTRVGSGSHRGISGGEMRRVSIGLELLANPDILILDEPTSGLDSVSAARIVLLLKSLTTDPECRTTIVASIHQPSSALYRAFSQVILLANGRQLYFGPAGNRPAEFFATQGLPCPQGYNVADHLLEVAIEADGLRYGSDTMLPISRDPSVRSDEVDDKSTGGSGAHHTPTLSRNSMGGKEVDLAALNAQEQKTSWWPKSNCATTFLTQFEVLASREWRNLRRDKALFAAHFFLAGIVGVFGGGCFFRTGVSIGGFQNKVGSMFFLGSLIAFSSLSALNTIFEVRPLFLRERSSNFYSAQTWILSRVVFDIIPLRIIPTILLSVIIYFMVGTVGIDSNAAMFFKFLLISVEFSIIMVLYNFLVASVVDHFGVAILLSSLWTMLNFVYAGFFANTSAMPPVLRWIRYIAPLSYTLEALTVNWIRSMVIKDSLSGVPIEISGVVIMETLFGFNVDAYYRNVLVLFAFIAGFGLMLVFSVFWFMREKR